MNVKPLFEVDTEGKSIAVITPESEWVLKKPGSLITIKLDGVQVKITREQEIFRAWPMKSNPAEVDLNIKCVESFPEDVPILDAYKNALKTKSFLTPGLYEAFGPGIKGNPMKCEEPFMVPISPMTTGGLVINRAFTKVKTGYGISAEDLYNSIKAELEDSPEIEGFVFLYEESISTPLYWASVTKKDMGLPWPSSPIILGENMCTSIEDGYNV